MLTRHLPSAESPQHEKRAATNRRTALLLSFLLLTWRDPAPAAPPAHSAEVEGTSIRLQGPNRKLVTGSETFRAEVTGPATEVRFILDGETRVQRRTPPYEATLFFGHLPAERRLEVAVLDDAGAVIATDALLLNARPAVLRVELLTPRSGTTVEKVEGLTTIIDLNAPPDDSIERLQLFRDAELIETIERPGSRVSRDIAVMPSTRFLRALVATGSGQTAEDVALINAPAAVEELEVRYVELYVRARAKRGGEPVLDLRADELKVLEDGRDQVIRGFAPVQDLPLHLVVLFDVSASIRTRLGDSADAARRFFEDAVEPSDRATLIAFNDRVNPLVEFSSSPTILSDALDQLEAERGTSLHDAVVYGLYQLEGLSGQRAVVLFSDGRDESSRIRFEDMLEYAQRAGVPVYAVRLETERPARRSRDDLRTLAEASGGSAFFVDQTDELPAVYDQILAELRTRYLVTFQSDQTGASERFRRLELRTSRRGVEVETRPGYRP